MNKNVEFDYVDIENSIVLGWVFDNSMLSFELEVALSKGHQCYSMPKKNERACFKRGQLIFSNVTEIDGLLPMENVIPIGGIANEYDYDTVHCILIAVEGYYIEGEFGEVNCQSEFPVLKITIDNEPT